MAGLAALLAGLPAWLTEFPFAMDLPQHVAQIRLWQDVMEGHAPPDLYVVDWLAPNTALYALIYACWKIAGPYLSGRVALGLVMAAWVASTFWLAWHRRRPIAHAALASALVFNVLLYWGLLNFMVGFPAFVVWWALATRPLSAARAGALLILSALLLWCHSLWFAFACFALVVVVIGERSGLKRGISKLATMLPVGLLSLAWFSELRTLREAWGFRVGAEWWSPLWARLLPQSWGVASIHGVGVAPGVVILIVSIWIGAQLLALRTGAKRDVDGPLLSLSILAVAAFLAAPDRYMNTIFFAWRWIPCGLAWMILALPAPRLATGRWTGAARAVAIGAFLALVGQTTVVWRQAQRHEFSGLREAIEAVPRGATVIGMDFVRTSDRARGWPFLQVAAWTTAWRGADTDFSFAEHAHGLVRYRDKREVPWTRPEMMDPNELTDADLVHFEFALVNLRSEAHPGFEESAPVEAVTTNGRFRLYRIDRHRPGAPLSDARRR
jgi:hypothetical protein